MPIEFIKFEYLGVVLTPRFSIYIVLLLVTLVTGLVTYKKQQTANRILVFMLLCTFLSECVSRLLAYVYGNSYPTYHVLIPVQVALYTWIYTVRLPVQKKLRMFIYILAITGFLFCILNSIYFQPIYDSTTKKFEFPSYSTSALSLLIVIYSMLTFYFMLKYPVREKLREQSIFWFTIGSLLFYSVTFFIFGFFNPLLRIVGTLPDWQYFIIWLMNLLLYGTYFIALLTGRKNTRKNEQ